MQRSVRFSKSSIPVCSWRLDVNMPPPQQLLLWHWQWMEDGNPRLMQNGRLCSGFLSAQSDSVNRSARQMLSPVWGNVLAKNLRITYWKKMICTDRVFVCVLKSEGGGWFWVSSEENGGIVHWWYTALVLIWVLKAQAEPGYFSLRLHKSSPRLRP